MKKRQYHVLRPMTSAECKERSLSGFVYLLVRSFWSLEEAEAFCDSRADHIIR